MNGIRAGARTLGAVVLMAALAACGGDGGAVKRGDSVEAYSPDQIYERGEFELANRRPKDAVYYFAEIERLYPYSEWAKQAVIMQAFAYHSTRDYENSRAAAQRFIDFYPADEDAAYAQYLLALSYYDQIDEVGRDQGLTFQALQALRTVIDPGAQLPVNRMVRGQLPAADRAGAQAQGPRQQLAEPDLPADGERAVAVTAAAVMGRGNAARA